MAVKSVSIRIEKEMLDNIGFIADYEGRSVNSHILVLVREGIREFEAQHGKIEGEIIPGRQREAHCETQREERSRLTYRTVSGDLIPCPRQEKNPPR